MLQNRIFKPILYKRFVVFQNVGRPEQQQQPVTQDQALIHSRAQGLQ